MLRNSLYEVSDSNIINGGCFLEATLLYNLGRYEIRTLDFDMEVKFFREKLAEEGIMFDFYNGEKQDRIILVDFLGPRVFSHTSLYEGFLAMRMDIRTLASQDIFKEKLKRVGFSQGFPNGLPREVHPYCRLIDSRQKYQDSLRNVE